MPFSMELTPAGVLAAGKWWTKEKADALSPAEQRSELLKALTLTTKQNQEYFSQFDENELVGKAATAVFLKETGIRSAEGLKTMTDDNQRNTLIVENGPRAGGLTGPDMWVMNNCELVRLALEWAATSGGSTYRSNGKTDALPILFADTRPSSSRTTASMSEPVSI